MSIHTRRLFLAALLLLLVSTAASGEWIIRVRLDWRTGDPESYAWRPLPLANRPPEGSKEIPDRPGIRYGRVDFGDGWPLIYAVQWKAGVSTLWIDRDRDGDLADEAEVTLRGTGVNDQVTLEVEFATGVSVPCRFRYLSRAPRDRLAVRAMAHREGEVVLEGRVRRLIARDGNGDLLYDDEGDEVCIDADGDGAVDQSDGSHERGPFGRVFAIRGSGYRIGLFERREHLHHRQVERSGGLVVIESTIHPPPPESPPWNAAKAPPAGIEAKGRPLTTKQIEAIWEKATKRDRELPPSIPTSTRKRETRAIGASGTKDAARFLLGIARRERAADLRAAAARALGYRQYLGVAEQMRGILRTDRDAGVQVAAIGALHGMGDPDRAGAYAAVLESARERTVAQAAAKHLAWVGGPDADRALGEAIERLARVEFRVLAYRAATRYTAEPPPVALIHRAVGSVDPALRAIALADARTLRMSGLKNLAFIAAPLASRSPELAREVVEILGAQGDRDAITVLLRLAPSLSEETRDRLVELLGPVRDPAAKEVLLGAMDDRDAAKRGVAIAALALMPKTGDALLERLAREDDRAALVFVIEGLGRQRTVEAVDELIRVTRRHRSDQSLRGVVLEALARIGLEHGEVKGYFVECLASRAMEDRILALDAAAGADDRSAADLLLPSIGDEVWAVRLTAIQGLGRQRVKRAVVPLFERFAEEKNARVRRALVETLFRITGADLGDVVESWRGWWKAHGESFVVPEEVPERPPSKNPWTVPARFYGIPIDSDRVLFVLDKSGSMDRPSSIDKNILDRAVDEALGAVAKLRPSARVNVILFDTEITPWKSKLTKISKAAATNLEKFLREQEPSGETNLYDALEQALLTRDVDTLVVLSDGKPNRGRWFADEDILREVRRVNRFRRIVIHTVALGHSSPLLYKLATEHGGTHVSR